MNKILNQNANFPAKGIYFGNSLAAYFNCSVEWAPTKTSHSFKTDGWTIARAERAPLSVDEHMSTSKQSSIRNRKIQEPVIASAPVIAAKKRFEVRDMKESLNLILCDKVTDSGQIQEILNDFIDQFMDENTAIYRFALDAVKEVIFLGKIPNAEVANALVYRFINLLREIGIVNLKNSWDSNPKFTVQQSILESLAELIKLVKIEDPKKLDDLVVCLIDISKNTKSNISRRHILDVLDNLHRTDNDHFSESTLKIEIEFLLDIRKKPCSLTTDSRTQYIFQCIHDNPVYGKIISDAQLEEWKPKRESK